MSGKKKVDERPPGSFAAVPREFVDSEIFCQLNHAAVRVLLLMVRQHDGFNNGHLHAAEQWMLRHGINSKETVSRAVKELEEAQVIFKTKQGGLGIGPSRYALTWLPLSNDKGLEVSRQAYMTHHFNAWKLHTHGNHSLSPIIGGAAGPKPCTNTPMVGARLAA